jgi:DNA-binding XRE family transcriptional regulator
MNSAESSFQQLTSKSLELWRGGWPDYLARCRRTNRLIGIEVKSGKGKISPSQALMFVTDAKAKKPTAAQGRAFQAAEALEKAKLSIFIWHPKTPALLIPWRDYQRSQRSKTLNLKRCVTLEVIQDSPSTAQTLNRKLRLAQIREQFGLTQAELGRRANLDQSAVSRLERGDDCLISTLKKYARALGGKLLAHAEFDDQTYSITL